MSTSLDICSVVSHYNVPLAELYLRYPGKHLVIGVAIFSSFSISERQAVKKLLLLQRAASEDAYPDVYEIPGGHAEDGDSTILDTVARETQEETGLIVKRIIGEFEGFEYDSGKGPTVQLNFVVEVEGGDAPNIKMNPAEHQAFTWVERGEDLQQYKITGSMRKVILDALKVADAA